MKAVKKKTLEESLADLPEKERAEVRWAWQVKLWTLTANANTLKPGWKYWSIEKSMGKATSGTWWWDGASEDVVEVGKEPREGQI